jgi:hypothetical protein
VSESTTSILIAAAILIVLALFVPCMESLARLLRRKAQTQGTAPEAQPAKPYKRDAA